jgi:hypothetical protein
MAEVFVITHKVSFAPSGSEPLMDADGPLMEQPSSRRKGSEQELTDRSTGGCYKRTLAFISGLVF